MNKPLNNNNCVCFNPFGSKLRWLPLRHFKKITCETKYSLTGKQLISLNYQFQIFILSIVSKVISST